MKAIVEFDPFSTEDVAKAHDFITSFMPQEANDGQAQKVTDKGRDVAYLNIMANELSERMFEYHVGDPLTLEELHSRHVKADWSTFTGAELMLLEHVFVQKCLARARLSTSLSFALHSLQEHRVVYVVTRARRPLKQHSFELKPDNIDAGKTPLDSVAPERLSDLLWGEGRDDEDDASQYTVVFADGAGKTLHNQSAADLVLLTDFAQDVIAMKELSIGESVTLDASGLIVTRTL